jgi:multidrug efflux pump subunit AcrA (membrane-fusion protein)
MPKFKMPAFFSKFPKRTLVILLVVVILAGAGGFAYYRLAYLPAQQTEEPSLQTATVRRGDLVIYASGTGTLTAAVEASFGFGTSGQVKSLYVKVGEVVEASQLVAELDNSTEEIQYAQAKRDLAELVSPHAIATAEQALAEAQLEVESAYSHLAYLISPTVLRREEEVAKVEAELAAARQAAEAASSTEADQKVKELEAQLELSREKLSGNQVYYEEVYLPDNFTRKDRETGTKYISRPSDVSIAQARAELDVARAAVVEAQNYLAALKGEQVPEDATGSSLIELENARLDLQSAEESLNGTRLVAPISGTIMSLDIVVGDTAGTSEIVTIADLSQKYLEVYLDETDWGNIAIDYAAEVTFDALPDQVFTGQVTQVDPGLYESGNTSVVRGLVVLDETETGLDLPIGSAAAVDVIAGRAENALLVPVDALRETSPGSYAVFVIEDGQPKLRVIEVGIQDLLYAEVKSGLEEGEVVSTGLVETQE